MKGSQLLDFRSDMMSSGFCQTILLLRRPPNPPATYLLVLSTCCVLSDTKIVSSLRPGLSFITRLNRHKHYGDMALDWDS